MYQHVSIRLTETLQFTNNVRRPNAVPHANGRRTFERTLRSCTNTHAQPLRISLLHTHTHAHTHTNTHPHPHPHTHTRTHTHARTHTHTHTQSKTSCTEGIYLQWFELRMWVLWEINSSIWNGGGCQCHSDKDWVMSKGSNGKEKGGGGRQSITYTLSPASFLPSVPAFFPSLCLPVPSLHTDITPPPCVVMCNVLKLARPVADCGRYRLISYKSGCSGQLPHSGVRQTEGQTREGIEQARIFVLVCVCVWTQQSYIELSDLSGLINTTMTDNTHFGSM